MKILHLCDSLNPAGLGGYESYLHYLAEQLSRRGHESIVVAQISREGMPNHIIRNHYRIRYLPGNLLEARKWKFYALSNEEQEQEIAHMFSSDDLELNICALRGQLLEVIQEYRPDIIHAHSTYVVFNRVLLGLRDEGLLKSIPVLVTIHGRPKPLILPSGRKTTDYDEFSNALPFDLILGVSDNVTEVLKLTLSTRKADIPVRTLYLGIDLSVFIPQPETVKVWDVAFMGRLEMMKAVDLFPDMLLHLREDFPTLKLLMTGEGSLRESLIHQFENYGVSDMVEYHGVVEAEKIPELINRSRIFIYPSREEPFGLSILEAMACAVPVVTTNVYGPSEILTHNFDGFMVAPSDVNQLVDGIRLLLQNDDIRTILGKNARKTVEARFDIKQHCDELVGVYEMLIHARKE